MSPLEQLRPSFRAGKDEKRSAGRARNRRATRACHLIGESLEERIVLSGQPLYFPTTYFPSSSLAAALTGIGITTDSVQVTTAPAGTSTPQTGDDFSALEDEFVSLSLKSGVTVADLSDLDADLAAIGQGWSSVSSAGLWSAASELANAVAGGTSTTQAQTDFNALFSGSGTAQSVIDQTFSDLVQTIQDSHVTTTDLATVAADETAFDNDVNAETGNDVDNQQRFDVEGLYYQGYGYMVNNANGGITGQTLSSLGVWTDQVPSTFPSGTGGGQAFQAEFASLAEKSGLTVGDMSRLNSDDQTISALLGSGTGIGVNWNGAQSAIGELVNAVTAGASTAPAQADYDASFSSGMPVTALDKAFNDMVQAIEDSHVTTADLSAISNVEIPFGGEKLTAEPSTFTYEPGGGGVAAILAGIGVMTSSVQVSNAPTGASSQQSGSDMEALENELVSLSFKSGITVADLANLDSDFWAIAQGGSSVSDQSLQSVTRELATAVASGTSTAQAQADFTALYSGSGVPSSVVDQTFNDLVQAIQDSHVTTTDLATVASDEIAVASDLNSQSGDNSETQPYFIGEGFSYQGYSFNVFPPLNSMGADLSAIGVLTDQQPTNVVGSGITGVTVMEWGPDTSLQYISDVQALQTEYQGLAEKSGVTVSDLNSLDADNQAIDAILSSGNGSGANPTGTQTAISELAKAIASGGSTARRRLTSTPRLMVYQAPCSTRRSTTWFR